jgi:hypothetical protein
VDDVLRAADRSRAQPLGRDVGVDLREPPEGQASPGRNVGDPGLVGLEWAEDDLGVDDVVLLRLGVGGGAQFPGVVVDEGDDLPELGRDSKAVANDVVRF